MLDIFKDEIPQLAKLTTTINQMLLNPKYSLEDIRETIRDHIVDLEVIDLQNDEKIGDADSTAFNAVDTLIQELEENDTNCNRIKDYITGYRSYHGFNRLVVDFQDFLTDIERKHLIAEGKRIFRSDITEHWT